LSIADGEVPSFTQTPGRAPVGSCRLRAGRRSRLDVALPLPEVWPQAARKNRVRGDPSPTQVQGRACRVLSGRSIESSRTVTKMHRTTTPLGVPPPKKPRDTMTSTKTQGVPSPGGRHTKRHSPGRHPRVATWRDEIHELPCSGQIHGSHSCGATPPHSRSLDSTLEVAKRRCRVPDATPEFLQNREPW